MKLIHVLFLLLFIAACDAPIEEDYRDPFEGTFQFTRVHKVITMCYTPSSTCVDGWGIIHEDTSVVVSEVRASETDRVRIKFGPEPSSEHEMSETIFPIVFEDGKLELPEHPVGSGSYFIGEFVGTDTIRLEIVDRQLIGGYDQYDVLGIRISP